MLRKITYERYIGLVLGIFSITGLIASFVLTIERFNLLKNPNLLLSCSINSTFNCASVMNSWQAELFGFPNTLMGLVGYSLIGAITLHLLIDRKLNRLIALASLIGASFATIFSYWLMWESVYAIKSICLYCLLSCISMTNIFIGLLIYCIKSGELKLGSKVDAFINKGYFWILISLWYLLVFSLVFIEFQSR